MTASYREANHEDPERIGCSLNNSYLARPSAMRACLSTSWMAVLMSMGPEGAAALGTSSP